jgi:hypothetical protein
MAQLLFQRHKYGASPIMTLEAWCYCYHNVTDTALLTWRYCYFNVTNLHNFHVHVVYNSELKFS